MKTGIMICGLNGVGKSTLGKALAARLDFHFIDNEDLYFPKTDPNYMYASRRSRDEVEALLGDEIKAHGNFIFVSVKGDYKIVEEGLAAGETSRRFSVETGVGNTLPSVEADVVSVLPSVEADVGNALPSIKADVVNVLPPVETGKPMEGTFSPAGEIDWYVVWIEVPRDIRLKRVRNRSFQKFGSRILPGGDLQEQEENFFRFVKERDEDTVEKWLQTVGCPVIRVDGTKSVEENVDFLAERISGSGKKL